MTTPHLSALAQLIPDGTLGSQSSTVNTSGLIDTIHGGARSGANLFHSFLELNVGSGRSLYFSDPGVSNILTRVTGSNPSKIDGRLGVSGTANLFLLNPNGIIFGSGASLDIRGSFTATTAAGIQFADGSEFSATNPASSSLLTISVPIGLQRGRTQPPAIIANQGNLTTGQDLTLDADRLELQGQLQAGRDLTFQAQDTLQVRDSATEPFRAIAGGNLTMQGNASVDILALSHPQTLIQAGSNLTLISDGIISGDAHFTSGSNLSFLTTTGTPGTFVSLFDPIIRADGNVTFGKYTGAALKVEATGSIQGGNIRITSPDIGIPITDPDYITLTTLPSVILRAGLPTVTGANTPQTTGGTTFTSNPFGVGNITVDAINTSSTTGNGGAIILEARNGNIRTAALTANTRATAANSVAGNGGEVTLIATNGNITITPATATAINTSSAATGDQVTASKGGAISLTAVGGGLQVNGAISTSSTSTQSARSDSPGSAGDGGALTLAATTDIQVRSISTLSSASFNYAGNGGEVTISSSDGTIRTDTISSNASGITSYILLDPGTRGNNFSGTQVVIGANGASGGNVSLTAPRGSIETATINSRTSSTGGKGGDLSLIAEGNIRTGDLRTQGYSIRSSTAAAGAISLTSTGGSLQTGFIDATAVADRFHPYNGQRVSSDDPIEPFTSLTGQGGAVQLSAPGAISVQRGIFTSAGAGAGDITITSQTGFVADRMVISSDTFGGGLGGTISITAPSISLVNGAQITASTHVSGQGGAVTLRAPEFVSIQGSSLQAPLSGFILAAIPIGIAGLLPNSNTDGFVPTRGSSLGLTSPDPNSLNAAYLSLPLGTLYPSGVFTQATNQATGDAGRVSIQTGQLLVQDGGIIATTTFGQGNAGRLSLQADDISVRNGNIFAGVSTGASGSGGAIDVQARSLTLTEQAQIRATTLGTGRAGDIQIQANAVTIAGESSGLFANTTLQSSGEGGSIFLTTGDLLLRDRGRITVDSQGSGRGGNIQLFANQLALDNATIFAETASSDGGNITLNVRDILLLRRNSLISASAGTAQARGNGGNITIKAGFVIGVLSENSDIRANAFTGSGGRVNITAQGIFGLKFQSKLTPFSDITASSQFGLSGTVTLNTLNIDPNRGLVQLPATLSESANQIAQTCSPQTVGNSFVVTGRGGVSPDPTEALSQTTVWMNGKRMDGERGERVEESKGENSPFNAPLVEATRLSRNADGSISLVVEGEPTQVSTIAALNCQTHQLLGR